MPADDRTPLLLRRVAQCCVLLLLAVTCLSAALRHHAAGLACADRPACYTQAQRADASPPGADATTAALRLGHRVAASAVLLLVLLLALAHATATPPRRAEAALAIALVALALALAVLGVFTPGSRHAAVAMGNLLGGFAMLALATRLGFAPPGPPAAPAVRRATALAAALVALQVVLGAGVSATFAGMACTTLADCSTADAAARVALAHRTGAVAAAAAVLAAAWQWRRTGGRLERLALPGLLVLQIALGLTMAAQHLPLGLVLAHNATAAVLLALLVRRA
jgi:heme a synthase